MGLNEIHILWRNLYGQINKYNKDIKFESEYATNESIYENVYKPFEILIEMIIRSLNLPLEKNQSQEDK